MSNKEDVAVDAFPSGNTEATHVLRKIDFHLAKKTYSCLLNTSDFKLETLNPSASSSSSQPLTPSSSKKAEVSEFLDSVLDADLTFRISFRRIGAGLENLGNTCFLNSVLQCLTYTEPLVGYLQSGKHQNTCHIAGFCALCAIQRHVSRALQSTGRIVAPKDLVSNLRCISRNFRNARQEDAHEYMIHLLESMHKCCLPSGVPAQSPSAYDKSLVHKIFGGRLRSQVKCLQCSYCSNTFDPFLDLSLEIAKADSLSKALVHFTAAEQLDGGERQYKCERCKHKVRALKQLTIYKAPYVLAIHLKRFRSHFGGQKIDKKVQFGSTLDLKPFVSGAYEGDLKYTLYGVLVHAGWSTHSGHYYCFVRTSSGIWYSLDDNRVVQASEKTVLEQKAYMLFYVRDRKNVVPKKALDIVHKESLITTMRNASSSCPTPKVKELPNDFTPRNPSETSPSSLSLKTFDSIIISEKDLTQKKTDTKSSEPLTQKSPKPTGVVASADCSGKVKDQVSAAKPVNLHCSSTDGGNLTSHVTNVAADTKDQDVLPRHENDCNSEKMDPPKSTAQIKSEIVIWKEETVTPKVDLDLVAMKSRPKLTNRKRSSKYSVCTQRRKLMKKIFGTGIGMHLSTKMLYGASSLKRRRCKIKKHSKCKTKKHSKKNMPHKNLPGQVDKGPVTSDRKSEALGIDERPQASGSSTETNHVGAGSSNYSPLQNGVSIAATKVFKETTVARWEGVDSPSAILESCNREITGIGYVPDEWDEEYDRGKKKKVRGPKLDFSGPNLFQEIATKKEKRRRKN